MIEGRRNGSGRTYGPEDALHPLLCRPETTEVIPETKYAKTSDGVHIAYQVLGQGPGDLVFVPGWVFNIEHVWEWSPAARFARRLASFTRLIQFDRRGTGLSDHIVPQEAQLTLEARMDDIRAVMDAAESDRAALFGFEEGFALSAMFAATYPDRVTALVAQAPSGLGRRDAERPWAYSEQTWDEYLDGVKNGWGTREFAESEGRWVWPDIGDDAEWFDHYATWMRRSVSPGDALAFFKVDSEIDVHDVLSTVRTPTLVVQRVGDQALPIDYARYVAQQIPGAVLIELNGSNHAYIAPDQDEVLDEIERFITGLREEDAVLDRVLATVLFTDIVGSTQKASALGDHDWKALLERHHRTVRSFLVRYRGHEVDTAGDGFFATFDGPARGARCAQPIVEAVRPLNLQIRAGVHTGEVERVGDNVSGLAVNIGARVGALAGPSEVLVSQTVKDLVVGSGISFTDAGEHVLKGVPDRWRLYRAVSEPA